ncbi:MAG: alpha-hydroxy-acid oxidizing protein [Pseudodesulfovibrio sp.]|uniref:FMN-dependent alpha-hydroxy acid dehydrogenase n=1 Tax=Pseudodesulfovibrio aespoeensis (strain ATCC 700646 / DSM 10631 / Aspo-2) TaxID=643562 RepID=E6VUY8_PSEA9|nr:MULTISPECIES: alpha-hydroxy-acid oxidizing protein [Pseudodesulfovibrio]MBU4192422.1 alpha-hydroxy-acid oxidizing protein [Pseudomonadota bacterium]ADU63496.1 FMN-dependent alpha-hydroxy acid dehydrogenase [Pseudodesulfovibrio aespoeensis Aspo-2]MBU4243425.1 alpha-hydroxy-acid oxidizing protein [Pseudomonadota bacterium]MBU4380346.1 alpha-hydroxy-acid oxidizing protein [Pseudomonadota bacterium]MBU4475771.1 alpha-hydroxy-acid oxidizing protein [Pseudomonadota bacterium]
MKETRERARELMKGYCRVCKVCDGKACAGEVPGMGGLGTAASFKNNVTALAGVRLNMRLVHDVSAPDTSVSLLGLDLAMPVLAAPIGGVSFNMGGGVSEEEYIEAVVGGCRDSGVIGCTGDGVPPVIHESGYAAISASDGHGIPFIKPWEGPELAEKLDKARTTGCSIFGMDVDAAGLVTLRQMGRPVSPKTPAELEKIIEEVHGWGGKFILKGIMTPDEALLAARVGADAIVVSNHGGRVLDHTPGTVEVLPEVAAAVRGRLAILVDGGVRDGADVLKMLALGADAVMIGRPVSVAAVGGLREGVVKYLAALKGQLIQAMVLTGSADIASVTPRVIWNG